MRRVIGVALMCTQTSPTGRPTMSRVVAMLCGDTEISRVTSRPGYLGDLKFDDITSFISDDTSKEISYSYDNSSVSTSRPMIIESMEEGR